MRERIDALLRVLDDPLSRSVGPELERVLKVLEDRDRLGDINASVGLLVRRIGKLTDSGVPGPRIIPTIRCLLRRPIGHFEKLNRKTRLQLLEHGPESRGHDAGANEENVGFHAVLFSEGMLREVRHQPPAPGRWSSMMSHSA